MVTPVWLPNIYFLKKIDDKSKLGSIQISGTFIHLPPMAKIDILLENRLSSIDVDTYNHKSIKVQSRDIKVVVYFCKASYLGFAVMVPDAVLIPNQYTRNKC